MYDTEALRDEIKSIRDKLKDGKISNSVARTLILAAKAELDTLKAEMEAARLGAAFGAVAYHETDRERELRNH